MNDIPILRFLIPAYNEVDATLNSDEGYRHRQFVPNIEFGKLGKSTFYRNKCKSSKNKVALNWYICLRKWLNWYKHLESQYVGAMKALT